MRRTTLAFVAALLFAGVRARAADDARRANSYDDAWQAKWVSYCRALYRSGSGKTNGFVLQVGDSIAHANPYSQWPRYGKGKTREDQEVCRWAHTKDWGRGNSDTGSKNGFYLAAADTAGWRGMTAVGGADTAEFLTGKGNGGNAMPRATDRAQALRYIADGASYNANVHVDTLVAAFSDARFAVLMLGTNDLSGKRPPAEFARNIEAIVDKLLAARIVVIISTLPPHFRAERPCQAYNAAIRALARRKRLPLIDYYAEILARRPGRDWNGTLLNKDDVHPTASRGGYSSAGDPYASGGNPATHTTGEACRNSGYLLRSWLTIQKLKEVKKALGI